MTSKPRPKQKKYRVRIPTATDIVREIMLEGGARAAYKFKRAHATDAERALEGAGVSARLADVMTEKEQERFVASFAGLRPGRTALTIPELTVITWLLKAGYSFGGVAPHITNPNADFFSQYPLEGGRSKAGGGNVSDIFISPQASRTSMGVSLAIDGIYFHQKVATASRDAQQDLMLRSKGYVTARIKDTQVLQPGALDSFMMALVGKKQ